MSQAEAPGISGTEMDMDLAEQVLVKRSIGDLLEEHPYIENFFSAVRLETDEPQRSVVEVLDEQPDEYFADYGLTKSSFAGAIVDFVQRVSAQEDEPEQTITSITLLPGHDKSGNPEAKGLTIQAGQVTCIVGPTGAGKTRLLEDIESLAQGDTPTGRSVLINSALPTDDQRFRLGHRLVAQLTQNMNFVMDLPAQEFITLHAGSRQVDDPEAIAREVIACANELAGEAFDPQTPLTQLSGGQSRALMIADTAQVSGSPIVLIDEIENAGIDRRQALDLLVSADKIVLMSTHDPILALLGDRRVVIANGGIADVIDTTPGERANLAFLSQMDGFLNGLRQRIRSGGRFEDDLRAEWQDQPQASSSAS
ncbi:ATP-binding cassette domain-containing protein [Propionibacterium sp.]|uniref:ATP-binding cassette domain-containing protein n=1 Tax=Propionibacterium sp. TaxID=1977903 RepID=UPI0039ECB6AF